MALWKVLDRFSKWFDPLLDPKQRNGRRLEKVAKQILHVIQSESNPDHRAQLMDLFNQLERVRAERKRLQGS